MVLLYIERGESDATEETQAGAIRTYSSALGRVAMPGAGKYYVPPEDLNDPSLEVVREDIKPMRYRAGRSPTYSLHVPRVSREDERTFRATAKQYHMAISVFYHFMAEAMRDNRLLILPLGYTMDKLISESAMSLIREEVERTMIQYLGEAGLAEPYRK